MQQQAVLFCERLISLSVTIKLLVMSWIVWYILLNCSETLRWGWWGGGDVAQLVEHGTSMLLTQVRFPGAAREILPRVHFQRRLSCSVHTPPSAIACIYICVRVKDPVVHVRVRWIMETLKHPACILSWVARLCYSWLSLGKATQIFHGRNPIRTIQL